VALGVTATSQVHTKFHKNQFRSGNDTCTT